MSNKVKLDLYDKRIIYQLEKNCKISISNLARKLNLSKQRISYKIKRLEEENIILGYSSIIDVSKLGYITFRIYIKFQNRTSKERDILINKICEINGVSVAVGLDGLWDVGIAVMVKQISDYYVIWNQILNYKEYIDYYYNSIYEPVYYMTRIFLNPDEPEVTDVKIVGANEKINYSEIDILLLNEYSKNIKQPIVDLANKLKKSSVFIANKIKYLEHEKIISWYRPNLNLSKLGYEYYKVFIQLNNFSKIKELYDYCISNKYIFQIDKTISEWDFEIEIYAKGKDHFYKIMDNLQNNFNKFIKNYTYFTVNKVYKEQFMP